MLWSRLIDGRSMGLGPSRKWDIPPNDPDGSGDPWSRSNNLFLPGDPSLQKLSQKVLRENLPVGEKLRIAKEECGRLTMRRKDAYSCHNASKTRLPTTGVFIRCDYCNESFLPSLARYVAGSASNFFTHPAQQNRTSISL